MELFIYLTVGVSVFCFVYCLVLLRTERAARGAFIEGERTAVDSVAVRLLLPYARAVGTAVARKAADIELKGNPHGYGALLLSVRRRILRMIFAAGNPGGMTPDEFLGLMATAGMIGLAVGLGVGLLAKTGIPFFMAGGVFVGLVLPVRWLRKQGLKRMRLIRRALPYSLDLLTLSVSAGLDFTEAMIRISRKLTDSPLGREFSLTIRSIQLGKSRPEALRALSWRVNMIEMSSITGAIIQADELGASLGPILRIQAEQLRTRRFHVAEEQAMKAPVKIIFPLALCILPTTLLLIFGALAIRHFPAFMSVFGARLGMG